MITFELILLFVVFPKLIWERKADSKVDEDY